MAKQNGFLKVEGSLGDVTFYKNREGFFMRAKSGVSKERILNDPAFKRTRENGAEFTTIAAAGKLLRNSNAILIRRAYDGTLTRRLMHVLSKIKNSDPVSARGARNVATGLGTPEGKAFLKGFDFNSKSSLRSIFSAPYLLDMATGKLTLTDFTPSEQLLAPTHATHAGLQTAFVQVDFATGVSEVTYSATDILALDASPVSFSLQPSAVPAGSGTLLYVFLVEFYQQINGVQYPLNNGTYNALSVLELV